MRSNKTNIVQGYLPKRAFNLLDPTAHILCGEKNNTSKDTFTKSSETLSFHPVLIMIVLNLLALLISTDCVILNNEAVPGCGITKEAQRLLMRQQTFSPPSPELKGRDMWKTMCRQIVVCTSHPILGTGAGWLSAYFVKEKVQISSLRSRRKTGLFLWEPWIKVDSNFVWRCKKKMFILWNVVLIKLRI